MSEAAYKDSTFRLSNRKRLLKGLFYEQTLSDKTGVLYTLKEEDHLGYPSLKRLYLECNDPTEYLFANQYLENWEHWEMLLACNWFKPYIARWRLELELKMRAEALKVLISDARSATKSATTSAKYLVERGWEPKEGQGRTRGRPTKDQINQAAHDLAVASKQVDEDFERLQASLN